MSGVDVVTDTMLASYLLPLVITTEAAWVKVQLANDLVREVIGDVDPVPARVKAIALEVAARPLRASSPSSVTITTDGTSKTTRSDAAATPAAGGVYLTDGERGELLRAIGKGTARRPRTIRLYVP